MVSEEGLKALEALHGLDTLLRRRMRIGNGWVYGKQLPDPKYLPKSNSTVPRG